MIHRRPYRPALSDEEAVEELQRNAGGQFDPRLAREFIRLVVRRSIVQV
jgi:HD-GYP domain-containing protein (c-di-GMP phosphodiesterase class II)